MNYKGYSAVPQTPDEPSELVRFFREEEVAWGEKGDYEGWSTERAAIELIRSLRAAVPRSSGAPAELAQKIRGISIPADLGEGTPLAGAFTLALILAADLVRAGGAPRAEELP